jgi:hypothetical protein
VEFHHQLHHQFKVLRVEMARSGNKQRLAAAVDLVAQAALTLVRLKTAAQAVLAQRIQ